MLFGLVGHSGVGKSALTHALMINFSGKWGITQVGFADIIEDMVEALGVDRELLDDKAHWNVSMDVLSGHTIREAVDSLGAWGRAQNTNMWINAAMRRAAFAQQRGHIVIIENIRFPAEFETVEKAGGISIGINRPHIVPDIHKETERYIPMLLPMCNHAFENDTSLADASVRFVRLISSLMD